MARQDVIGGNGLGKVTATAGTKIRRILPPLVGRVTRLNRFKYTPGANSHLLTAMRALGQVTVTAAVAAAGTSLVLSADPGPSGNGLAANDLLLIRETDNVTRLYVVSSWTPGTSTVVLTAGLTAGVAVGAKVWDMGVEADTDPKIGAAHPTFDLLTGAQRTLGPDDNGGVVASHGRDEPVLLTVDNVTAAGTIDETGWYHTAEQIAS